MRSDTIKVSASGEGMREAIHQAEAVAAFKGLPRKESLRLMLLTEEMMGLLRGLTGEVDALFYIDDEDNDFRLHLITDTAMNSEKRKKLMDASTSHTNEAAVGFTGKLRSFFERAFEPLDSSGLPFMDAGMSAPDDDLTGLAMTYWSLNNYREHYAVKKDTEEWDELERSIVAKVADEIRIGIKGSRVEMTIYKKF